MIRRRQCFFAVLLPILISGLMSCAVLQGKKTTAQVAPATPEMVSAFRAAEQFYFAKKYDDAIFSYQSYTRNFPYNSLTGKANYRLGEIALTQGKLDEAIGFYKKAVAKGVNSDWGADAIYKQTVALHKQGKYSDIFRMLDRIPYELMSQRLAIRAGSIRVSAAKKAGNKESRFGQIEEMKGYLEVLNAYEQSGDASTAMADLNWLVGRAQAQEEVRTWLGTPESGKEDQDANRWASLVSRFEGKPVGQYVFWKVGSSFYAKGDYKKAGEYLQRFLSGYPKSEFVPEARKLYAEVEKRGGGFTEDRRPSGSTGGGPSNAVGVLLPLSGKYAVYGESVLHGIECAAGIFEPCHSDFNVKLVVRDTEGKPQVAAKQMKELIEREKVVGVIGPLPQVEVDAVVPIAEQSQTPIIALSQREDVPKLGEMVFRNFLTVKDQVGTVVQYACGQKRWKRLGILYPKGSAGAEFLHDFEEEVDHCGGKVVAKQSYGGGSQEGFTAALAALKAQGKINALFIPDVYRRIVELIPSVEFANIPDVVLLGGAGWDHPDLLKAGNRLDGSVFVDGFYADSSQYGARDFSQMIHSVYGVDPTLLEAYAYDTMKLMGTMMSQQHANSRSQLHGALTKARDFSGVTGSISFDDDGDARRKLFLLQISGGNIKELN